MTRFFVPNCTAKMAGKMKSAPLFSAPPPAARPGFWRCPLNILSHKLMGRGRPKIISEKASILVQSVSSKRRCVWCGADVRGASSKGAPAVAVEMVTVDDRILAQLLVDHQQIVHADARLCKARLPLLCTLTSISTT